MDDELYPKFNSTNIVVLDPSDLMCDLDKDRCYDVKVGLGHLYNGEDHQLYVGASLIAKQIHNVIIERAWDNL